MEPHKIYLRQIYYNGIEYTKAPTTYDTYAYWGVVCREFPFSIYPEPKAPVTRDWPGEDGLEVYFPKTQRFKEYDIDVSFIVDSEHLYLGEFASSANLPAATSPFLYAMVGSTIYTTLDGGGWNPFYSGDIDNIADKVVIAAYKDFVSYIYGRKTGSTGSFLAIYDEYTETGRKDVNVKKITGEDMFRSGGGNPAICSFKVTFTVYDPVTDVSLNNNVINW